MNILVTGATGQLGNEVATLLADQSNDIQLFALVRDLEKDSAKALAAKGVQLLVGDYNEPDTLAKAFEDIDKLYFVSGTDIPNRSRHHENVVEAARKANVKHVLYTSFARKNDTDASPIAFLASSHIQTEELLKSSGMDYTLLRHSLYADVIPMFIGNAVDSGTIYLPAGDGKTSYATRSDMAKGAVAILTSEGHENKIYDITGSEAVSYHEIATYLSDITGKSISYTSPAAEEFEKVLSEAGLPAPIIQMTAGFAEAIKQNEFDETSDTLEKLIGHKPVSVKAYLQQVFASK